MSHSLRKSCHACTVAKRACRPQLPKCDRCEKKGIECIYDLEPVVQTLTARNATSADADRSSTTANEHVYSQTNEPSGTNAHGLAHLRCDLPGSTPINSPVIYDSLSAAREAAINAVNSSDFDPNNLPRLLVGKDDRLAHLRSMLRLVPEAVRQQQTSPFVHGWLYKLISTRVDGRPCDTIQPDGLDLDLSLPIALLRIHSLMASILDDLLDPRITSKIRSISSNFNLAHLNHLKFEISRMLEEADRLWSSAPHQLSSRFSSFETWVIGESVRRCFVGVMNVRGLFLVLKEGSIAYQLYVESLVFDPRAGLWECENEESWEQVLTERWQGRGKEGMLVSLNEFTEICGTGAKLKNEYDGMIQRLIWGMWHGREAIKGFTSGADGIRTEKRQVVDSPSSTAR